MRNKETASESSDSDSDVEDGLLDTTPIAVAVPVTGSTTNISSNRATSSVPLASSVLDSDSDAAAREAAAAAREAGIADIRNHCEQHLSTNPSSSYVTWIATLHPENAQVTIDPRFLIEGNPWLVVYEEAKEDLQKGRIRAGTTVTPSAPEAEEDDDKDETETATFSGCLDLIVGSTLVLTGILSSFTIEICAAYAYLSYWLCCKIVDMCSPPGLFSWLPLFLAWIIGKSFLLIDVVLLFFSIVVVECIAAANYLVCTILGCSHQVGKNAHQMTRKMSHLVRWAFRRHFEDWEPSRTHFERSTRTNDELT
mmetsp:Transcript_34945/g.70683  ORF Transcript_34945/g.70683 Transcript_34945/m.70683 type:complete len:310 (-) Transcript_34945:667-1596(-)|eukprot:CAMPEP_0178520526 /NCGR_PEP_ID=MMETSP0696-20121128/27452_1 /TAXON_ID=265572 /ORGANISM="Extubocellulus spinifer, Strain CCMP396" /LENGTH=309 /DNA_ID=CAMNT_0020151391 /DNA_START=190 /DNA_END=1119 /DNA_ORIENTATION=+